MSDRGHELTDDMLADLEEEIKREYQKAVKDVEKKLQDYLEKTEKGRLEQKALLDAGKITQKQYNDWVYRHTMVGKRWEATRDALAKDLVRADAIAQGMIRGKMPDVYALNMNFATFQIEHDGKIDTGFTLYNRDSAQYLLGDQRELMPGPSAKKSAEIRANKDMQWNMRHIQSAVLQGILQGESPYDVAARLRQVGQMDASASIRYARTMTTSAQNAGRYQAFRRARDLGVQLTIEWQATLDNRTRHEHRMMHGQRRDVDEPFVVDGIKILYPAEGGPGGSDIPQRLIWNCRCTLLSWVKGFEGDTVKSSPGMGDMSFEEWQEDKRKGELAHRSSDDGSVFKPISDRLFEALVAGARAQGAEIIRDEEWVDRHLGPNRRSSNIGDLLLFKKDVSKSDVHEELRHFWQRRTGFLSDVADAQEQEYLLEIDAKKYLINNGKRFRIPRIETEETRRELEHYEDLLRTYREGG